MWVLWDVCMLEAHARVISSGVIYLIMILNIRNSNSWCVYPDWSVLTSLAFFFPPPEEGFSTTDSTVSCDA